ncbi:SPFH/Band 7/PHB domain protein, partial [Rhodococcus hoagii]|nr:SPFH/Band 7/PHB domain protein [Prescottella equi]
GFAKTLGAPGDDGVFRYEPSRTEDENLPRPEDDSDEVASWFETKADPAVAQAVRAAEAVARTPVESPLSQEHLLGGGEQPEGLPPGRE